MFTVVPWVRVKHSLKWLVHYLSSLAQVHSVKGLYQVLFEHFFHLLANIFLVYSRINKNADFAACPNIGHKPDTAQCIVHLNIALF